MIIQFPKTPFATADAPQTLEDVRDILLMLSVNLALIASPKVPIERARAAAAHAQRAAEAYAEVVTGLIEQGGAQ